MAITIRLRRDSAANWTSTNPTLALGEAGYETDTRKLKVGDGSTVWNSLQYTASVSTFLELTDTPDDYTGNSGKSVVVKDDETGLEFGTGVRCGSATLSSGSATVSASWVTAQSRIVATPLTAPGVPGSTIYIDNVTADTSFDIKSEDITDGRQVMWLAGEQSDLMLTLPTTFYVSYAVTFSADEITADDSSSNFAISVAGLGSEGAYIYTDLASGGQWTEFFIQGFSGSQSYTVALDPATEYVIDLKFEYSGDFSSVVITPRIDGTPLVEGAFTDSNTGFSNNIGSIALGACDGSFNTDKRDYNYFKIGTGTWGDSDLLDADFSTLSPFDSLQGTGIALSGGSLSMDGTNTAAAYAIKAVSV